MSTLGNALEIAQIKLIHEEIVAGNHATAANMLLYGMGQKPDISLDSEGDKILRDFYDAMVDANNYVGAAALCWGPPLFHPELNSVRQIFDSAAIHPLMLSMGASSMGKCIKSSQPVMKYNGVTVRADQIKVGDVLMGDDGGPRTVFVVNPGKGPMYRITPKRGEPWECNDAHILSLRVGADKICGNSKKPQKKWKKGDIVDIPIQEYIALSKDKKSRLKQFHVGVEMPAKEVPFSPYVIGAWLGDGTMTAPTLNTPDGPMAKEWIRYFKSRGFIVTEGGKLGEKCRRYSVTTPLGQCNPFRNFVFGTVVDGEKRIPDEYLVNSMEARLGILAGLIDSDGWVHQKTGYGFVSKYEKLARQVEWLCRSVGLCARVNKRKKQITSIGFIGEYWMVSISGQGITKIPTLEKRACEPSDKRVLTNTSFTVESIGDGDYYGFVIDGNHRFLLGDFTVTHNTYNLVIFCYMDWLRDPEWTSIKLMSQSDKHLTDNVWPHLMQIHEACALKPQGKVKDLPSDLWMGLEDCGKGYGFAGMAFKQSQLSSGAWKGFKPQPKRPITDKNYAAFGPMTKLRVLMDEAQQIPEGVWQDLNSVKASVGENRVKIFAAFNPEDVSQPVVRRAEPPGGWHSDHQETLYSYESAQGWWVERLDGAKCENVVQRKELYPGVMRYEAYIDTLKGGGDSSPRYWCVDESTQALTKRGWMDHSTILESDLIYSVNPQSGRAGWMPLEEVFRKHYDGHLVSMEGQNISALVTDNHRWAITHKQRLEAGKNSLSFRETKDLKKHDEIPLVREGIHPESGPSDDYAKLLGWVASDGTFSDTGQSISIGQSFTANPAKCDIIAALLSRLKIKPRIFNTKFGIRIFNITGPMAQQVRKDLPAKQLTIKIIEMFPLSGKREMLDALIMGDGGIQGGGTPYISTNNAEQASVYAALAARCGLSTATHERFVPGGYVQKNGRTMMGHVMFYVNIKKAQYVRNQYITSTPKEYHGIVWCPRTPNGTFLARRNGLVYFTGNTFARGFPPLQDSANTIIPPDWASTQRGEAMYEGDVTNVAAMDIAYQGADKCVLCIGRWGMAYGWRDNKGKTHEFVDRLNPALKKPHHVLTIDQFLTLPKSLDAMGITQQLMGQCKMLKIEANWVAIDATGNGVATYSYAAKYWGRLLGINWAEAATETKILTDDLATSHARFDGVPSEMWFALKHWIDPNVCAVLFNPIIQSQDMYSQMTTRRYKPMRNGRLKVEAKDEYKARNGGKSPDEMDTVVMLLHLIRMRSGVIAGIVEHKDNKSGTGGLKTSSPTSDRADVEEPLELNTGPDGDGTELDTVDIS